MSWARAGTITGLLLLMLLFSFRGQPPDEKIPWQADRPLRWEDFRGALDSAVLHASDLPPDKVKQGENLTTTVHTEADAYCYHQIDLSMHQEGEVLVFDILNAFRPDKSWSQTTSAYILNHEQRHFDLAEVHARLLRKALQETAGGYTKSKLQTIFDHYLQLDKNAQQQYDAATQHSVMDSVQASYNHSIDSQLHSLDSYAATRFTIPVIHSTIPARSRTHK